jgi:hypothetical protein
MAVTGGATYGPMKPYDWPQDKVKIPNGQGLMPRLDERNAFVTKREGMFFTAEDTYAGATAIKREYLIETPPDGDFWCNGIRAIAEDTTAGNTYTSVPGWKINIIDVRTGWDITFPYARFGFFKTVNRNGIADANKVMPQGSGPFKSTSTLIQPFCFTRNGAIRLIVDTTDAQLPNQQFWQIAFIGWKEYQYASR